MLRFGKRRDDEVPNLFGGQRKAGDVVHELGERCLRRPRELQERVGRVRHCHERNPHVRLDEAAIRLTLRGGVEHLRCA